MILASLSLLLIAPLTPHDPLPTLRPSADLQASAERASAPVELADAAQPHGVLRYRISGGDDRPMPCRLTFISEGGGAPNLFPNTQAAPKDLAVRKNVVYTLSGEGAITVPVGTYTVYATRGMEYGLVAELLSFEADVEQAWNPKLPREVTTRGWIGGDFHLHTLTHSGHGDSNMEERMISLIGEGVEFAVATDHNHHTDYAPTLAALGGEKQVKTVVGNEVSTPIGHLNSFPLDPERPVADPGATNANELFKFLRAEPNQFGVVPVIQLNHPRWGGIDYFTQAGLDPITGTSASPNYSGDFDTLEVLNSNPGWGYHDADTSELDVGAGIHSVLQDWYNLLNRGHRYYAVGNSDSHTVRKMTAGYPRNYVACDATFPWQIDVAEVTESLRAGRVFTTTGPFVEFKVNGAEMGETIQIVNDRFMVYVRIRAPQWMYLNRVKFVINGELARTVELDPFVLESGEITWPILQEVFEVHKDSWVHVIVEGDEPLEPVVTPQERPILPLAITNPVWVHQSSLAQWTPLWDWAQMESGKRSTLTGLNASEAALLVQAAVKRGRPQARLLVQGALSSKQRRVQLMGMRCAESMTGGSFVPALESHFGAASDAFFALTAARALAACDSDGGGARLLSLFERFGRSALARYPNELDGLLTGRPVRAWSVIGYFDNASGDELFEGAFGPLGDPGADDVREGKGGAVAWHARQADEAGYLDLGAIDAANRDRSISYARTWLRAEQAVETLYALGSDDGARLWINGVELYTDRTQHGASPLQHLGKAALAAGWNEVLIGVENGGGATGMYFRVLDAAVEVTATRP